MNNPEILTERMRLRLIDFDDLVDIHLLHSIPAVNEFNTTGIPNSIEETIHTVKPLIFENQLDPIENYTFAIESNSTSKFMGLFGFKIGSKKYRRGEVWYKIHPDYWNKGFATEALIAVIHFGFDTLDLHRIQAGCAVENIGSIKVLEKAGMIREGRGRKILPLATGWADNFEYSILETDQRK